MDIKEKVPVALRSAGREKKPSVMKKLTASDGFVLFVWILGFAVIWENIFADRGYLPASDGEVSLVHSAR